MNKSQQFLGLTSFEQRHLKMFSVALFFKSISLSNRHGTCLFLVIIGLTAQLVTMDSMPTCPFWTAPSTFPPKLAMHFIHCSIIPIGYWCTRDVFLLLNFILKINLNFELSGARSCYWIFMLFPSLWIFNNFNSTNIFICEAFAANAFLRKCPKDRVSGSRILAYIKAPSIILPSPDSSSHTDASFHYLWTTISTSPSVWQPWVVTLYKLILWHFIVVLVSMLYLSET